MLYSSRRKSLLWTRELKHGQRCKVNKPPSEGQNETQTWRRQWKRRKAWANQPNQMPRNPTTSFLTAANWIYALGAGITAAAGTRLALQLVLIERFNFSSFRLSMTNHQHRYLLSLPRSLTIRVICAPAAFLGSSSHLSGSLSGIEP